MTRPHRIVAVRRVAAVLVAAAAATVPSMAGTAGTVAAPSVISASATAAGLQVHVIPGQYHPTFDTAFIESFPYNAISADSSPSARATAAPADVSVMDHYPDVACVFTIFAPYCPYAEKLPLDPYVASASSSTRSAGSTTSFPCHPGADEPPSSLVRSPSCSGAPSEPPPLADSSVQTDASPAAHALSRLGTASLELPGGNSSALSERQALADALLAAAHRSSTGVDAAAASGTVVSIASTVVTSDVHVGSDGVPVESQSAVFHDVDVLGGLVHADAVTLTMSAATLGQAAPHHTETATMTGLSVMGTQYGNVDAANCEAVTGAVDAGDPAAGIPGLAASGFALHCATVTGKVVSGAAGFGLNPVEQTVDGPSLSFTQPADPLDQLRALGVQVPDECVAPGDTGLPSPPPSLGPLPLPGEPSSTCQFVSSNTFADNGFSVTFGHLNQRLAAQPPLPPSTGFDGAGATSGGVSVDSTVAVPGAPGTAGTPGIPGHLGTAGQRSGPSFGAIDRAWLLLLYGLWEVSALGALGTWAAVIRRRRREAALL